jgi:CheY-like chemotaxis protein
MSSHRKTVLVADDNEDLVELFAIILRMQQCRVVTASNGAEAVVKASVYHPDLVLMDIRMPVMDGYEATRRILSTPGLSEIPIIAISAHHPRGWTKRAIEAGCVECVNKPVGPEQLQDIIGRYV